jgi:periplasmic divalent cation tolerance protein
VALCGGAGCLDLRSLNSQDTRLGAKSTASIACAHDFVARERKKYKGFLRGGAKGASVSPVVIVLTTWPATSDAGALARTLVDERLAACVNVLAQMQSTYRWKDAIESEAERQILIKTTESRLAALEARLRELHPYDVPEFLMIRIDRGAESYVAWLEDAVARRP